MKEHLKESRYKHSLGVQEMAEALSERYGVDIEKASFAGRYHDIAKCFENELMDSYIKEFALDSKYLGNNNLAHSKVGAEILKHKFGVKDEEILEYIISDLAEKWRKADKDTLEAYRYYKERTESNRD